MCDLCVFAAVIVGMRRAEHGLVVFLCRTCVQRISCAQRVTPSTGVGVGGVLATPTFLGSLLEIPDFKHATSVIYAEKETTCNLNTSFVHEMIVIRHDDGSRG